MIPSIALTPEQVESFWSRVDRAGGANACWAWMKGRNGDGYGQVTFAYRNFLAHRIAHGLTYGPPPPDKPLVLHSCDNPGCCNPAHLFLGTHADNTADKTAKGRQATGDRHGSRLHPESRAYGARHGRAKLTETDIPAIRAALARREGYRSIARRFGVSHPAIRNVENGKAWSHVPADSYVEAQFETEVLET